MNPSVLYLFGIKTRTEVTDNDWRDGYAYILRLTTKESKTHQEFIDYVRAMRGKPAPKRGTLVGDIFELIPISDLGNAIGVVAYIDLGNGSWAGRVLPFSPDYPIVLDDDFDLNNSLFSPIAKLSFREARVNPANLVSVAVHLVNDFVSLGKTREQAFELIYSEDILGDVPSLVTFSKTALDAIHGNIRYLRKAKRRGYTVYLKEDEVFVEEPRRTDFAERLAKLHFGGY